MSKNVYQSTQENAREREGVRGISKKPLLFWHGASISGHVSEFDRFDKMISVENWAKLSRVVRDLRRLTKADCFEDKS